LAERADPLPEGEGLVGSGVQRLEIRPDGASDPRAAPKAELSALWRACMPLDAVPFELDPAGTGKVQAYLSQRDFDVG